MATLTQTIYLTWATCGTHSEFSVSNIDLSILKNHTAVSNVEVTFDIGDFDNRLAEIEQLEQVIEETRAESQAKINLLLERISNLQAIGHEVVE